MTVADFFGWAFVGLTVVLLLSWLPMTLLYWHLLDRLRESHTEIFAQIDHPEAGMFRDRWRSDSMSSFVLRHKREWIQNSDRTLVHMLSAYRIGTITQIACGGLGFLSVLLFIYLSGGNR